jgi:rubredoxin
MITPPAWFPPNATLGKQVAIKTATLIPANASTFLGCMVECPVCGTLFDFNIGTESVPHSGGVTFVALDFVSCAQCRRRVFIHFFASLVPSFHGGERLASRGEIIHYIPDLTTYNEAAFLPLAKEHLCTSGPATFLSQVPNLLRALTPLPTKTSFSLNPQVLKGCPAPTT